MPSRNPEPDSFRQALQRLAAAPHPPHPPGTGDAGYQIPWSDPAFSRRMLQVHLDPQTHMASRRPGTIDGHVDWLCTQLALLNQAGEGRHILDVGCGPGLYLHRLAERGHRTTGFDFAPEPLAWARAEAARRNLDCRFLTLDLIDLPDDLADQVGPVDAVTFWFGEFHTFAPEQAADFLPRLARCLRPGGLFVLEYQPEEIFVQEDSTRWSWQDRSVFCDRPHLWLEEFGWDPDRAVETHVHWILEQDSGKLSRYVQRHHAWSDAQLADALAAAGLVDPVHYPPITGADADFEFPVLITRRAHHHDR